MGGRSGGWDKPFKKEKTPSSLLLAKPSRKEVNLPGIIYNRPTQFSARLRIEQPTCPFCPGRPNHRTSAPHTNSKATVPRQSLARKLESHSHAHWHEPLSSGRSLAGCRAGLLLLLQLGNSLCIRVDVAQPRYSLCAGRLGVMGTQASLLYQKLRESVQTKPT